MDMDIARGSDRSAPDPRHDGSGSPIHRPGRGGSGQRRHQSHWPQHHL